MSLDQSKVLRIRFRTGDADDEFERAGNITVYAGPAGMAQYFRWTIFNNMPRTDTPGWHYTAGGKWAEVTLPWVEARLDGATPSKANIDYVRLRVQSNSSTPVLFRFGKVDVSVNEVARLIPSGPCPSCSMTTTGTSASAPMRGTLSCIADSVTNPEHTTLGQLQEMHADDWEIACHANSIAGGSNFTTVPADQLRRELDGVQQWAARSGFQTEH